MGFKNVANASGGFDALKNVGFEIFKKKKNYFTASATAY